MASLDTAERKRNDQGFHECEVYSTLLPEAAESCRSWSACSKNPGHAGFIPYPEFRLESLPENRQTQEMLNRVRELADRTVRLRVGYTSRARPDGYAFSNFRGSDIVHTGSGWMDHVRKITDHPCPCPKCAESRSSPHRTWFTVWVFTACHVVYNVEEARASQVDFFYDDEQAWLGGKVKTVWAFDMTFQDPVRDVCILACATHDAELAQRLDQLCPFLNVSRQPCFMTPDLKIKDESDRARHCVIVSHPHGCPKQVTLGEITGVENTGSWEVLGYSANTCPGSSGAAVLLLDSGDIDVTFYPHLHSRGGDSNNHASAFFYRPLHHRSKLYSRLQGKTDSQQLT